MSAALAIAPDSPSRVVLPAAPSPAVRASRGLAPPSPLALAERAVGETALRLAAEWHRLAVTRERVAAGAFPEARAVECEHRLAAAGLAACRARWLLGRLSAGASS